jgi:hypothetical protein
MILLVDFKVVSQNIPGEVMDDADDFIDYYGYDEDYSRFVIRTNVSLDYGLCDYDPCDYYDEEQGVDYDHLTTLRFDPATGLNYDLYGGYQFNRFISAGVNLQYFHGLNFNQTRQGVGEVTNYLHKLTLAAYMFSINPTLFLSPGFSKLNPWMSMGVVIGALTRIKEKETQTNTYNSTTSELERTGVYHGGVPIGFDFRAGVDYKLSKTVDLFADIHLRGMNYTPTKFSVKTYTNNGMDEFSSLSVKQRETEFVKELDRYEQIPADSPDKQLKRSFPFTAIGLDFGVKINLGNWERF